MDDSKIIIKGTTVFKAMLLLLIITTVYLVYLQFTVLENQSISLEPEKKDKLISIEPEKKEKLIWIIIDGAEWKIINNLTDRGFLPNIKYLKDNGIYTILNQPGFGNDVHGYGSHGFYRKVEDNIFPDFSDEDYTNVGICPAPWTEMSTGVLRHQNGITDWNVLDEEGNQREIQTQDVISKQIWEILSDEGYTVGVYGFYATWPAKIVNGFIFNVDLIPPDIGNGCCEPSYLFDYYDRDNKETENAINVVKGYQENNNGKLPDFLTIGLHNTDIYGHLATRYMQPEDYNDWWEGSEELIEKYGIVNENSGGTVEYTGIDNFVGEIMELYKDYDYKIIFSSDHGMDSTQIAQADLFTFLDDLGLQKSERSITDFGRLFFNIDLDESKIFRCIPFHPRTSSNAKYELKDEEGNVILQKVSEDFCVNGEQDVQGIINYLSKIEFSCSGEKFFTDLFFNETLHRIQGDRVMDYRCISTPIVFEDDVDDGTSKGKFPITSFPFDLILPNGSTYKFTHFTEKNGQHPFSPGVFIYYDITGMDFTGPITEIQTFDIAPTILKIFGIQKDLDGKSVL